MTMSTGQDPAVTPEEQCSAWLDDELPVVEVDMLIRRLERSTELKGRVARYGLVASILRGGDPAGSVATLGLRARVGAALDREVAPAASQPARWAGFAAAAGLALLAVTLVPLVRPAGVPAPAGVTLAAGASAGPTGSLPASRLLVAERVSSTAHPSLSPRRLTNYLVYHGEYSGMLAAKLTDSHIVNNRAYAVAAQTMTPPVTPPVTP